MANIRNSQLTLDQAYQAAYVWPDHAGDPPIEISEPAHGAVELLTETAFVRVRISDGPVEQSSVLALLRAAAPGKRLILFSPSGFSPGAVSIAESQGISLFTLDPRGRAVPGTTHARSVAPDTEPDPPVAREPRQDDPDVRSSTPPLLVGKQFAVEGGDDRNDVSTAEWSDCPACGTAHYRDAKFCKECGVSMNPTTAKAAAQMQCRNCGSHDIETLS